MTVREKKWEVQPKLRRKNPRRKEKGRGIQSLKKGLM